MRRSTSYPPCPPRSLPGPVSRHGWMLSLALALLSSANLPAATSPKVPKTPAPSKPTKEWVTFRDCAYAEDPSNDADSFRVRSGKKSFHVRLYFVDAPESKATDPARVAEQAAHFGLSTNATLAAGTRAIDITREWLRQPFDVHTRWTVAGGRSREPRYYAIVEVAGRDLGEHLVEQGWARAKGAVAPLPSGEPSGSMVQRLRQLESDARRRKAGAWGKPRRRSRVYGVPASQRRMAALCG